MNIKKIAVPTPTHRGGVVTALKYLFLVLFLCLLVAVLYAAQFLRQ